MNFLHSLIHYDILNKIALGAAIETAVYRIVQEALTNVARHAQANEVKVCIIAGPGMLEILVEDRGIGFEYDRVKDEVSTAGIKWMNERLALLGGHLKIDSMPGFGTGLMAGIPIKSERASR